MQEKEMYEAMYEEIRKAKARRRERARKKRQKELAKTVLIIIMLLYIAFDFYASIKANRVAKEKIQVEHIVSAGETLWSIADALELDEDIRETVYRIDKENACGKYIIPGQILKITYYK